MIWKTEPGPRMEAGSWKRTPWIYNPGDVEDSSEVVLKHTNSAGRVKQSGGPPKYLGWASFYSRLNLKLTFKHKQTVSKTRQRLRTWSGFDGSMLKLSIKLNLLSLSSGQMTRAVVVLLATPPRAEGELASDWLSRNPLINPPRQEPPEPHYPANC